MLACPSWPSLHRTSTATANARRGFGSWVRSRSLPAPRISRSCFSFLDVTVPQTALLARRDGARLRRSEEHTSELQSRQYLVCRLLLEKKKKICRMSAPTD